MVVERVSSLPLADGVSVWPGEQVTYDGKLLTYVGMLANFPGMMVLQMTSGERVNVHHLKCRL